MNKGLCIKVGKRNNSTDGNFSYSKEVENFNLPRMQMRIEMFPSGLLSPSE